MRRNTHVRAAAVVFALCAVPVFAGVRQSAPQTQTPPQASADERPWAKGVTDADKQQAMQLFREGNQLLKESVFVQAAAKYREALKHWDHPAIHYNLVLALVNLDQPVELHEHLEAAMKYGPEPLDQDKYEQARAYKALVEKQLAKIQVACDVEGASVVMDGRPLFVAPGHYEALVRAGPHTVVATREGYLTNEVTKTLPPGEVTALDMKLYRAEDLTQYRRRWPVWMPWTVLAAGVAVAGTGGYLHTTARQDFIEYDKGIVDCGGCVPSAALKERLNGGTTMQTMAIAGYAVGGAAIATGATLLFLNRPEPYRVKPGEVQVEAVSVVPLLSQHETGVWATFRF